MSKPDQTDIAEALRAIRSLGELLGCHDGTSEDKALYAFINGRAAFWPNVGYHNAAVGNLCDAANDDGLLAALDARPVNLSSPAASPLYLIASLIPLNGKARAELHRAREAEMAKRDHQFVKTHLAPLARELEDNAV